MSQIELIKDHISSIFENIENEYFEIEDKYHWPELRRMPNLNNRNNTGKLFANMKPGRMVGFEKTIKMRWQMHVLWKLIEEDNEETRISNDYDNKSWLAYIVVRDWGGIRRFKYIPSPILEGRNIEFDELGSAISSWSKILTCIDPEKYQIYDSRVACYLNKIIKPSMFYMPKSRSKSQCLKVPNILSVSDSYSLYLYLVDAVANLIKNKYEKDNELWIIKQKIEMTFFEKGRFDSSDVYGRYYQELKDSIDWWRKDSNEFKFKGILDKTINDLSEGKEEIEFPNLYSY